MTPKQVLRGSTITIRVLDSYVPSLHYMLLIDEEEPEPFSDALQLEDTTKWEQAMDDEMSWMSRPQNCVAPSSTEALYVAIAKTRKKMILMTDYVKN